MYAIVNSGGKQFKIQQNSIIRVPSLNLEVGAKLRLDEIVLLNDGSKVEVGTPFVEGAYAEARVLRHARASKVRIIKYKRRKGYMRKIGHRQGFSELVIDSIVRGEKKKKAEAAKEVKPESLEQSKALSEEKEKQPAEVAVAEKTLAAAETVAGGEPGKEETAPPRMKQRRETKAETKAEPETEALDKEEKKEKKAGAKTRANSKAAAEGTGEDPGRRVKKKAEAKLESEAEKKPKPAGKTRSPAQKKEQTGSPQSNPEEESK